MLRAYAREPARPDSKSEQTHDDYEWLNEEDGEENVLGNVRGRDGCDSPPAVAQDESWGNSRKNDACSQNCARNCGDKRRTRFAGLAVFR